MTLDLTDEERQFLLETLQERLGEMRQQVYHTSTPDFKDELKARETLLLDLIARCQAGDPAWNPPAAPR